MATIKKAEKAQQTANTVIDLASNAIPGGQIAADALKKVLNSVGGVRQSRFIDRTMQVDKIFDAAGYKAENFPGKVQKEDLFTQFGLRKTQVKDRKTESGIENGTYYPEFERLRQYIVYRLNKFNPGLGEKFAAMYPAPIMANRGNTGNKMYADLETLVNQYPPFTFTLTANERAKLGAQAQISQAAAETVQQIAETKTPEEAKKDSLAMLVPFRGTMAAALHASGINPPTSLDELAQTFYNTVVTKSTSEFEVDNIDENVTNAIIEFIIATKNAKQEGKQLPPVLEKVADGAAVVEKRLEQGETGAGIMDWIKENPIFTIAIAIALIILIILIVR